MRQLLHGIDRLYTCDATDTVIDDAHVIVEGDRIAAIGAGRPEGAFDHVEDLSGCLVVPGLVNLHHHFFQTLTRAIPATLRGHLMDWLAAMYPIWSGMTPEDLAAATEASVAQLLLTGATTTLDHSYHLPRADPAYVAAELAAAAAMGIRLELIHGSITALEGDLEVRLTPILGPAAGGLVSDAATTLAAMRHSLATHHQTGHGAMLRIGLGPTTTTYDDPAFMRDVARLAEEAQCLLHTHCHPRPDERATCEALGTTPFAFLRDAGWLTPRTLIAHGTRIRPEEMALLAAHGAALAHCPRMLLRLGARVTPVHTMRAAGMRVGIGVDGGASNDSGSMLGELRIAHLMHRVAGGEGTVDWQDWLSPYQSLCMATREAAAILGRDDIGRIAPGLCADLAAFRMTGAAYAGARSDPLSGLLLAGDDDRAWLVMVAGRVLVRARALTMADEDAIGARTDAATARLIDRAAGLTGIDYHRPA